MDIREAFAVALQHHRSGNLAEAEALYRKILEIQPNHADALHHLGIVASQAGRPDLAIELIRRVLPMAPEHPAIHLNLGEAYRAAGRLDEAVASFRRARELQPDAPGIHYNLGLALAARGEVDEAIAAYRRALELKPDDPAVHSSLIYTLHLRGGENWQEIAMEQQRWNRQFFEPVRGAIAAHSNGRDPERPLRIGYLSPDLRFHSVAFFLTPLLEAHDRRLFEIYGYASLPRGDAITARLQKACDVWRDVYRLTDAQLAERIREDRIDILVDLALHTAGNRLPAFARKPAPVQVSWLGFPGSTGLPAIDYRLTDALLEPEGSPWPAGAEAPARLPETWYCFAPLGDYPELAPPPALRKGHVTFGCLNNFSKINEAVLRLWVEVLRAVGGAQLLFQCPAGRAHTRVREWFQALGIAPERIELVARIPERPEFTKLFERIDIALDPFPYNGGTTTFEALWMGIPVVTLAGASAVSRVGKSALTNIGLAELVADRENGYVEIAARLANDLPRLAQLRQTLRAQMQASPLMNASRFARNVEAAYRRMWTGWCER